MNDYAKDMLQPWWTRPLYYFRWATFIPGGVLGGILAAVVFGLLQAGSGWLFEGSTLITPWVLLVASGTCGAAMIYIAAHIAPTDHKRTPVVIMATVCTCIWLLGLGLSIAYEDWFEGFRQLVALGACIVTAVVIYKESPTTPQEDGAATIGVTPQFPPQA